MELWLVYALLTVVLYVKGADDPAWLRSDARPVFAL